jgi:hypothetical protein
MYLPSGVHAGLLSYPGLKVNRVSVPLAMSNVQISFSCSGASFRVYEFTGRYRQTSVNGPFGPDMLTALDGGFIGALQELTFNIWMMNLPK